uniref:Uncharacterized protein n=1 Tax=Arundo donax TaxID=35708 RepID=A0A0A9D874_ARUDO
MDAVSASWIVHYIPLLKMQLYYIPCLPG